jgi:hypothetical protein
MIRYVAKCKICGKEIIEIALWSHLKHKHYANIEGKDVIKKYYDEHIKKGNEGKCKICGEDAVFYGFKRTNSGYSKNIHPGYSNLCSKHSKSHSEETYKIIYGDNWKQELNNYSTKKSNGQTEKTLIEKYGKGEYDQIRESMNNGIKKTNSILKHDSSKRTTNINYWLNKGYSIDDAKKKLKERQATSSKKKFIEKYGEKEGLQKYNEYKCNFVIKFKRFLNSASPEKLKKMYGFVNGYSDISQELFKEIHKRINNKFVDIYYAINGQEKNNEYCLIVNKNKVRKLDFYIPSVNKWIEFDGNYWHDGARGNQQRDNEREKEIKESINGIKLMRVKETDYNKDKDKVIKECVEFILE